MKLVAMIADAARLDAVRADLDAIGVPGYTVLPVAEGHGRTGWHAGDRVHPGALALVVVIEEDERAARVFEELVKRRDARGDAISRVFLSPVERMA
jgi:nitrogen regulatory protein PII